MEIVPNRTEGNQAVNSPDPTGQQPETLAMTAVRDKIGDVCNRVHFSGRPVVLTFHDDPRVVLVPYSWWQQQTGTGHQDQDQAPAPESSGS